jgi:hypothetical protein
MKKISKQNLGLRLSLLEKGSLLNACRALDIFPSKLSGIIGGYIKPSGELKKKISQYTEKSEEEIFPV